MQKLLPSTTANILQNSGKREAERAIKYENCHIKGFKQQSFISGTGWIAFRIFSVI